MFTQGIGGKHLKYDQRTDGYVLDPSLKLPPSVKDVALALCELGWLYSKVNSYVQRTESAESSGQVAQAFGYAIQVILYF